MTEGRSTVSNRNLLRSGTEGRAAAAGLQCFWNVEDESAGIQSVVIINGRAHEIETLPFINVDGHVIDFEHQVVLAQPVETENVGHCRTATTLDADTQAV